MLGFPIIYFKGMRRMMFQLSGFHCKASGPLEFWGLGFRVSEIVCSSFSVGGGVA